MMDKFWDALKDSTVTQAALTIMVWGGITYMSIAQLPIPEVLQLGGTAILGYWFGAKNQYQLTQVRKQLAAQTVNQDTREG